MRKRGISPLIASVLLIAFAVTLFLIISTWTRTSILEPGLEKGGEKYATGLECLSTRIEIVDGCVDNKASVSKLKLSVDNKGSTLVYKLSIRAIGGQGAIGTVTYPSTGEGSAVFPPDRILSFADGYQTLINGPVAALEKIEVFPHIKGGLCQDNLVSISSSRVSVCS